MRAVEEKRAWIVCLALMISWPATCAALDLELSTIRLAGGEFRFTTNSSFEVDELPFDAEDENLQTTRTEHHEIFVPFDGIRPAKFGFFRYKIYVKPIADAPGKITCFTVQGKPVGSFLAQMADVDFFLGVNEVGERGQITLPIFSLDSPAYLLIPSWTEPETVELPGEREIALWLKNALEGIPILVTKVYTPAHNSSWHSIGLQKPGVDPDQDLEVGPAAKIDNVVIVKLVPNSFEALARLLLTGSGKPHERVTVNIDYSTYWGLPRSTAIEVPVRFVPGPLLLSVALVIGVSLGSLLPVLAGRRKLTKLPRAFLVSFVAAILLELIGIYLMQHDSELRVFGFVLDPRELVPAALLGACMGVLGFKSWDFIEEHWLQPRRASGG